VYEAICAAERIGYRRGQMSSVRYAHSCPGHGGNRAACIGAPVGWPVPFAAWGIAVCVAETSWTGERRETGRDAATPRAEPVLDYVDWTGVRGRRPLDSQPRGRGFTSLPTTKARGPFSNRERASGMWFASRTPGHAVPSCRVLP